MKRISVVFALMLLGSLALMAANAPTPAPAPSSPASCSLDRVQSARLIPEPLFKSSVPPPCYAVTTCPDGSTISCPNVSYDTGCWSSDGCWVQCEEGFIFCPGRQTAPECALW